MEKKCREAIDLALSATGSLEEYKQDAVRTKDGRLEITLNRTPVPAGKRRRQKRQGSSWMFTSGMLQSWNKMCIQGGLVEGKEKLRIDNIMCLSGDRVPNMNSENC